MSSNSFLPIVAPLKFYAVVPSADWVARMVDAGANTVQLRNKTAIGSALYREIERSVAYAKDSPTQLFINDFWWEAVDCGAYGVHLGQEDLESADLVMIQSAGLRLGVSTHSSEELAKALTVSPSYVACGAIFPTKTKTMPSQPLGLDKLRQYVSQAGSMPTVAIGGIDLNNAGEVLATGISSLAVVRAVTEATEPEKIVKAFQALWQE
ncbi:thiamine-phosphate diphosphorylase [Snodgrassella communis]|uniref:Thiamine-phosphate synthase n=1 Tax=Snodgrassella communis TaxID=2946699 RepID=A0A836MQL7_9NEIS|nr:thiamine phosphate synthase [Snodgrassella communis]KDN15318.1 Thiamin-phosphate pyrophosphorylase [Snodgrassella communis]PIT09347.1 thiamine-phosphate diphosphorylase [Snodgrassella communis]PIT26403.1 thiamine-phosphate diphosphorylase [Snodgrassella communis]PIT28681.1 thiamine-phosphate diphosphorylase [Snodgrassella communis]PIT31182.1 thiamine-phosphate diphosphorylase [Snodgrassella communis]